MEDLAVVVDRFRSIATEATTASHEAIKLLSQPEQNFVAAIVGLINARTLNALADVLEQQSYAANASSPIQMSIANHRRYSAAISKAMAEGTSTGNFDTFDKLIKLGYEGFLNPPAPATPTT